MSEEFNVEEPEKVSMYNSGMAQIKRLDELWNKVHKYAEGGLLTKWNWILDRIWMELIGDLDEEEELDETGEEEIDKKNNKQLNPINRFDNFNLEIGSVNKQFIDKVLTLQDYQRIMYQTLMGKEAFLRRLQNKLGKGTKLVDVDEDMIE